MNMISNLNDRQKAILKELDANRQVRVAGLAKSLFASEMTIRRDLEYLENEGFLTRCHGGAIPLGNHLQDPIKYRMWIHAKEKKELAAAAQKYLRDGQVVFFNSSSTCAYMLPYLNDYQNLHIVTNSIYLAAQLGAVPHRCTLTGGDYRRGEQCLCGGAAEAFLAEIHPDLAILSCEGVTEEGEITESLEEMARIARLAVRKSAQSVFLMDPSKHGNRYTYTVCRLAETANAVLL